MFRTIKLALVQSGVDTLENLAQAAGVERTRMVRIANGRVVAREEERAQIGRVLRMDPDRLFVIDDVDG